MPSRRLALVVPQIVGRLNLRGMPGVEPEAAEAIARAYDEALFPLQRFLESLGGAQDDSIPAGQYGGIPEILDTTAGDVGDPEEGWSPGPHRHQVLVAAPVGLGNANAAGLADELADAAHVHKRDVRVLGGGADVGTRNALNLVDSPSFDFQPTDDAGNDRVDLTGVVLPAGIVTPIREESANYPVVATDLVILGDASGGAITITLPLVASSLGKTVVVKKIDSSANAVKIDGNGAETIDGAADFDLLLQDEVAAVVCDGTEWWLV